MAANTQVPAAAAELSCSSKRLPKDAAAVRVSRRWLAAARAVAILNRCFVPRAAGKPVDLGFVAASRARVSPHLSCDVTID